MDLGVAERKSDRSNGLIGQGKYLKPEIATVIRARLLSELDE
jgi:hypothetical protein